MAGRLIALVSIRGGLLQQEIRAELKAKWDVVVSSLLYYAQTALR